MMIPQITNEETKRFSSVWNWKGIAVPLDDVHIAFATDYSNVCLRSLFAQVQEQVATMAARIKELETAPVPSIVLTGE